MTLYICIFAYWLVGLIINTTMLIIQEKQLTFLDIIFLIPVGAFIAPVLLLPYLLITKINKIIIWRAKK